MRAIAAVLVGSFVATVSGGAVHAQDAGQILSGILSVLDNSSQDQVITRAFRDVLNRDPSSVELRRYRQLMQQSAWTDANVRQDLQQRTDYRRYTPGSTAVNPTAIVRRAYEDILGREPDAAGMRSYRSRIVDQGWTEQDVRNALRGSGEYASTDRRTASADRIVRRAYQDILGRDPDPAGLEGYRRNIIENGWDEQDVRQALRRSPEKRGLARVSALSDAQATEMVRQAYLTILNREPDAGGLQQYKNRMLADRWTQQQVMDALRNSPEYRSRR